MKLKNIVVIILLLLNCVVFAQKTQTSAATLIMEAAYMKEISPLIGKELIPQKPKVGPINPRRTNVNKIVPGKGYPRGQDKLLAKQKSQRTLRAGKAPSQTFTVATANQSPSDPTGAVGPNHYVSAKNYSFAIHDKTGNVLLPSTSLENLFPGESLGDPIVFYDSFADRFVITQFSDTPNGFLVAVSRGSDPVNSGWFTYRFITDSFPDYTKFSVWSDGYYVTANKDQGAQQTSEVVFVIERDKMLVGDPSARMIGFPLPGANIAGFYSPAAFNAIGKTLPPRGEAKIIYYQDDEWLDVPEDALKLWTINTNWIRPDLSTITEAEVLNVSSGQITPFDSTFDGGSSFSNIPQPGTNGNDIDALQGAVMYATNYRKFCDHNSVTLNFVVDIDNRQDLDNIAGIRWYELRQDEDGQPWYVYQEGTYASPDGKSAWCASMAMDMYGNIGMGYTTMGTVANGATADSFVSLRYTGRLDGDVLGSMTIAEQDIVIGTGIQRNGGDRYGDYAQLTVDPVDDQTFYHIGEYFEATGDNARDFVGVFKIANSVTNDIGVVSIAEPLTKATFSATETISIKIQNFGTNAQSNFPVSYTIDNGPAINEIFTGTLNPGEIVDFTFATTANLSLDKVYTINAETNLASDIQDDNDCALKSVEYIYANDLGVVQLISPVDGGGLKAEEFITISIFNFGSVAQSNFSIFYSFNGGDRVTEVFTETIAPRAFENYTFNIPVNMSEFGTYTFQIGTSLSTDEDTTNDSVDRTVEHQLCKPESNCQQFGDGIVALELANISNPTITCENGYKDFTDLVIKMDRSKEKYILTLRAGFASEDQERFSLWIDYNDNNIYEDVELIFDNEVLAEQNQDLFFNFPLSQTSTLGRHLMRIRAGDVRTNNGAPLNNPCDAMQFGTTHDYTVEIGESNSTSDEILVFQREKNKFVVSVGNPDNVLKDNIIVFSITGQVILFDEMELDANNNFIYDLDLSFRSTGMYFIRIGNKKKGKAAKIIVF
ncbi:GEVED domain-containing protein [Aquimarina sp. W85]|uniref:GEVED domain-containing protein n=1 Tax=Aquimarina rhodophyticola TaxID=3342246 RepID=UPI00366B0E7E